jgi:hypothetical protein
MYNLHDAQRSKSYFHSEGAISNVDEVMLGVEVNVK